MSTLLDVKNLGISFGGLRAVNDFDLKIQKEELYGLIGPNGAGKTTVFNLLTGVYKPDSGKVLLDGKDLTGKKNIEISKAGIARTFQNIRLFKELTVLDNVKVGLHNHHHYSTIEGILRLPNYRKVEKEMSGAAGRGRAVNQSRSFWVSASSSTRLSTWAGCLSGVIFTPT